MPMANQYKGNAGKVLHFFEQSTATNRMVLAGCGKLVNPGFAKSALETPKAHLCKRCLLAIHRDGY